MKLELKDYQLGAVTEILDEVENAMTRHQKSKKKLYAISLSSPTGSGKTIIMTSIIETILHGSEDVEPIPDAVILWVSDQPTLNEQTKRKMSMHSSHIKESQLVMIDHSLDQRTLDKGKIYFSNIQQLGKGATKYNQPSDKRKYPLWDTISNTVNELGEKFILIIDEAHRGTSSKGGTIVQQLMDGKEGNLPAPIVIGISATPGKFIESMSKDPSRTLEQVDVDVQEVKKSGLIKDKLVIRHPKEPSEEDMTLLSSAIKEIKKFEEDWLEYSKEQDEPIVVPLLVIQVPPGCTDELYGKILQKIKTEWPEISDDDIKNSMQGHNTLSIKDTYRVKYVSPPDIQDDNSVRVVLFKQALNTGWDCPRAEVMISFAVAKDQTYVAQTIGRMVRTPLARKIGTNSFLNTVSLYLPRFDADAVENVVKGLNDGDGSVTSDVIIEGEIVPRNPNITQEVWDAVGNLPTYSRASKHHKNEVARMNKMAFLLNGAGIDKNAINEARGMIISTLSAHVESIDKLKEKEAAVRNADIIKVEISLTGEEEKTSENSDTPRSPQDLDNLFRVAKRILPDNVAMSYWNALCEEEE